MGIKRPLGEENFLEPWLKQPKQHDHTKKLTLNLNSEDSQLTYFEADSAGEANSNNCKLLLDGHCDEGDTESETEKEYEASASLSLVISCNLNGNTSVWPYLPGYVDLGIARDPPERFEDPYMYLLNCMPRKEVPVGADYQAEVPHWDSSTGGGEKAFSGSNYFYNSKRDQHLSGTCIIPFPVVESSTDEGIRVGRGRVDCSCLDLGSMRCVQEHVSEAREKLMDAIGEDNFSELGFYDMGDEVAHKWTPADEQVFQKIVLTNPSSQGRNFWRHLTAAFPTRTKKEFVSYYFNVFMLYRRAVQNRSYLEMDSDDDEEQHGGSCATSGDSYHNGSCPVNPDTPDQAWYLVGREEKDSTVELFDAQDLDANWMQDFWSKPSHQNHSCCNGNVEKQDFVELDGITKELCGQETKKLEGDNLNFDS